jgi:hypothetical protein
MQNFQDYSLQGGDSKKLGRWRPTFLRNMLPLSCPLKIGAASYSKILIPVYKTTQHHVPEDQSLDTHHHENLKPHMQNLVGKRFGKLRHGWKDNIKRDLRL